MNILPLEPRKPVLIMLPMCLCYSYTEDNTSIDFVLIALNVLWGCLRIEGKILLLKTPNTLDTGLGGV